MTNKNVNLDFEQRVKDIIGEIKGYGFGMLNDMIDPQFVECDPEHMTCKVRYRKFKWEDNGRGEVHGGVISAMMDTTMGINAIALTDGSVSTSDMTISFLRPFRGKSFIVESEAVQVGSRVIRLMAKAFDEETGKCLAMSTGSFMHVDYEQAAEKKLGV
ncbi:MAG: PaaI family thioesterase [Clostridiales bacterium]|nr:PaaI family thioesterase [Clostridiales bacterium]MBQ3322409.1 PaaI family thioesterase [Bacillota bacterium]MBR0455310.1 PaaI family thioesterase [Bacillota bacterium]